MKKVVAILLAAMMLLGIVAFAEEAAAPEIKIGQVDYAAHGKGCFAVITAVIQGDVVLAAKIDEFQYLADREDIAAIGVPNSDGSFGENYPEGKVLGSKRVNSDLYSLNMQRAGSKVQIAANFDAIEKFVAGKTIEELEKAAEGEGLVDAISGATVVDAAGYVKGIVEAAKVAHAQYAGTHGGATGTYTLWNTTGEDIVGIYLTDLDSGWQSVNYAAGAVLHTVGSENDNNPYIITRTVTEAEVDNHMRIWAETESGKIIEFPGQSEHTGLSIETANINFMSPEAVTGATQIGWFPPQQ